MFRRIWGWLRRPNTKRAAGGLIALGVVGGLLAWGAFNAAMDYTNTTAFCVSCHEMDQLVHQEYKQSMHYKNPSGVRAGCPDCHVPREWDRKLDPKKPLVYAPVSLSGLRPDANPPRVRWGGAERLR